LLTGKFIQFIQWVFLRAYNDAKQSVAYSVRYASYATHNFSLLCHCLQNPSCKQNTLTEHAVTSKTAKIWSMTVLNVIYASDWSDIYICVCGPNSSVSIATDYGLEGLGIKSRWGRDFFHTSRPALGPTQLTVQWVLGLSQG
jgi:hypothetical protein